MATGSYLTYTAGLKVGAYTDYFSVTAGDYIVAVVSGFLPSGWTMAASPGSPSSLSSLASLYNSNDGVRTDVFGGVATQTISTRFLVTGVGNPSAPDGPFVAVFFKVTPSSGETLSLGNATGNRFTGNASVTTGITPTLGDVVFGFLGSQYSSAVTGFDSDTTNGTWSTFYGRNDSAYSRSYGQFKNVTSSGLQTYNVTQSTGAVPINVFAVTIISVPISSSYWGINA